MDYSSQGRKELDTTERLHFHFLCIHTQFRIQQSSIACLYPQEMPLSLDSYQILDQRFSPLSPTMMCVYVHFTQHFSAVMKLKSSLVNQNSAEAISTTPLYVLQDCNHYSAILKPLFLFHIQNFILQLSSIATHLCPSVYLVSFQKTAISAYSGTYWQIHLGVLIHFPGFLKINEQKMDKIYMMILPTMQ